MPKRKYDEPIISPWERPGVTEDVRRMASDGLSSSTIAAAINLKHRTRFTRSAIMGKLYRLGVSLGKNEGGRPVKLEDAASPVPYLFGRNPWTNAEIDTMTKHSSFGADALSRLIKRSAKAIYRKASAMGIKLGGPKLAKDDRPKPRPLPLPYMQPVGPIPEGIILACEYPDAVPLMQIGRYQCREIIGDAPQWHMCGSPVEEGLSWCPVHAKKNLTHLGQKEDRSLRRAVVYHGHKGSQPRAY